MACNVFGTAITDSTLSRGVRAQVALNMMKAEEKDVKALNYVENLKKKYGDEVFTLCLVYNATGDNITYSTSKDWCGHLGQFPYPGLIANGQWGAFLHVQSDRNSDKSVGNVVYPGKSKDGKDHSWLLAWSTNDIANKNRVYTQSRSSEHYLSNEGWIPIIYGNLNQSGLSKSETWCGCLSTISTGSGTSPIVVAILTLEVA